MPFSLTKTDLLRFCLPRTSAGVAYPSERYWLPITSWELLNLMPCGTERVIFHIFPQMWLRPFDTMAMLDHKLQQSVTQPSWLLAQDWGLQACNYCAIFLLLEAFLDSFIWFLNHEQNSCRALSPLPHLFCFSQSLIGEQKLRARISLTCSLVYSFVLSNLLQLQNSSTRLRNLRGYCSD